MKLLDLFCGAGGASMGYHLAGFDVVGIDTKPQPDYPFEFHQADAMTYPLDGFDVIHASPPCQVFSRAGKLREAQGGRLSTTDLLAPTRERLINAGVPYIIENVPGAPMVNPVILCGSSFGLGVRRHRLFESSMTLTGLPCNHKAQGRPIGVYHRMKDSIPGGGKTANSIEEARHAMGIDWMSWPELKESIPPAYTEHIGRQVIGNGLA